MIAKKILLLAGFSVFLLASSLTAMAYEAPRVYVKEINIKQVSFNEGNSVEGDFLIWNAENSLASGLSYSISLEQSRDIFNKQNYFVSESINPDKIFKQAFSYPVPKIFPAGEYVLKIQIFSQSGVSLGWKTIPVSIKGTGVYLNIANGFLVKDGKNIDPGAEVSFDAGSAPKIRFTVYNPGTKKIDFKVQAKVYASFENPTELDRVLSGNYSVDPKKSKTIELDMPKYQDSGTYLAKVILLDQDAALSQAEDFVWTIKGSNVKIVNVLVAADSLEAGKEIKVSVDFAGTAEQGSDRDAVLSINLYDEKTKKNLATGEKKINLDSAIKTESVNLMPNGNSDKFAGEVKITKNGQELASYSIGQKVYDAEKSDFSGRLKKAIIIFLLILIIVLIFMFFMKYYRKGMKLFLLLFLIGGGIFGGEILKVAGTYEDVSLILTNNQPIQDLVVDYKDSMAYEGSIDAIDSYGLSNLKYVNDVRIKTSVCDINKFNCVQLGNQIKYNVEPSGAAYNTSDNKLYVIDDAWYRPRILKIDPVTKNQEVLDLGGTELYFPRDILYAAPYLYVADRYASRILRFDPANIAGTMQIFDKSGVGGVDIMSPEGIFYSAPYLFVADRDAVTYDNRLVRMNLLAGTWDIYPLPGVSNFGDIVFDPVSSFVYLTDIDNNRIVKFDPADMAGTLADITTDSSSTEAFSRPKGIYYVAPYLYVADSDAGRIVRLNPGNSAVPWLALGSSGSGVGQFNSLSGLSYYNSNIYVGDTGNSRVVKFDPANMNGTWNAYDFIVDSYNIGTNIPSYFNPGFELSGNREFYAKTEIFAAFEGGESKNIESFTRIKLNNTAVITPVTCKLYGVTDSNGNDTGIITIDPDNGKVIVLTEFKDGDFENLDIDPFTNYIYVATDQSKNYAHGRLFIVNGLTGALTPPAGVPTGVNGLVALSFNPVDGNLWGWSKEDDEGLIKIVINRPSNTVGTITKMNLSNSSIQVEGLAWNNEGTVLYASAGNKLYRYDAPGKKLVEIANNLPGPAEALDTRTDGKLYVGKHNTDFVYVYDPITKTNIGSTKLTMDASSAIKIKSGDFDIEGLAWPGGCSINTPTAINLSVSPSADFCAAPGYVFKWTFSDSDAGSFQGDYRIQVDNDSGFGSPIVDQFSAGIPPVVVGNDIEITIPMGYGDDNYPRGGIALSYGTTYYWRIMVWDNTGTASGWKVPAPATFDTEEHSWPDVRFTPFDGSVYNAGDSISFSANGDYEDGTGADCYQNAFFQLKNCSSWNWDFCSGVGDTCVGKTANIESPVHIYPVSDIGFHKVTLKVTDTESHFCSYSQMIEIQPVPPVPFDFNLSPVSNINVVQGSSGSNIVTATLVSGATQSVNFSASGLPAGAIASWSGGASCSPTCSKTLTISTAVATAAGTYTVTVTGAAGLLSRQVQFDLTVTDANTPPTIQTVSLSQPPSCDNNPVGVNLSWMFKDIDAGDIQSAYQLTVNRNDGIVYDSGKVNGVSDSVNGLMMNSAIPGFIDYNYNYTWVVKVWDNHNVSNSDDPRGGNFATQEYKYPEAGFTPPPPINAAIVNIPVLFKTNGNVGVQPRINSICYRPGNVIGQCQKWEWNFGDGETASVNYNPPSVVNGNKYHTFTTPDTDYYIVLAVTDEGGHTCSNPANSKMVSTKSAKWKEVIPTAE